MRIQHLFSLCFISVFLFPHDLLAQHDGSLSPGEYENQYRYFLREYRFDPELVNGIYYENQYFKAIGHPFLFEDKFYTGSLVYREKRYDSVELRYDIYNQSLILKYNFLGSQVRIILPEEFISEFSIDGRVFRKYTHPGREPAFYQVIADHQLINCRYYWYKEREESDHNGIIFTYKFLKSKRQLYIEIGDQLYRYRNNRSFIKLFPEGLKNDIAKELKLNSVKVSKSEDQVIIELMDFCEALLNLNI